MSCVDMVCQRCLDIVNVEIKADIALQVVWSEDHIANVAPDYEPWVVADKIADLNLVIEDEIFWRCQSSIITILKNVLVAPLYSKADTPIEEAVESPLVFYNSSRISSCE